MRLGIPPASQCETVFITDGKDFLDSSHNAHARTRFFPASSSNRNLCVQPAFTRERFQGNDSMTDRIMEQFQVQHRKKAYGLLRLTALDKSRDKTDRSWKMVTKIAFPLSAWPVLALRNLYFILSKPRSHCCLLINSFPLSCHGFDPRASAPPPTVDLPSPSHAQN